MDEKKAYCRKLRAKVDLRLSTAISNGLFSANRNGLPVVSPKETAIRLKLDRALSLIEYNFNYVACLRLISEADSMLHSIITSLDPHKRFVFVYGGEVWTCLLVFLTIVVLLHMHGYYETLSHISSVPLVGIYSSVWGAVGGLLRGIWYLWINVNKGSYRIEWRIWFLSCPFLGGIFGAIAYLLIVSTLVVVTKDQNTIKNPEVIYFVAVFAGFNWQWFISLMRSTANAIHNPDESN